MIRSILTFVLLCMALHSAHASTGDGALSPAQEFARANSHYEEDRFVEALEIYERLLGSGVRSSQVLANAGNASYQVGDKGRAVLYYLRALRMDPRNDMARQNLARVQPRTNMAADEDLFQTIQLWLVAIPGWMLLVVAEAAFIMALAMLLIGTLRARAAGDLSEWGIRAGGLILIAALAAGAGFFSASMESGQGEAVVLVDGAVTRAGPGERFMEQLSLPAGTLVELPEPPAQGWVRCRLKDGRTGFIRTETLERI